MNDWQKKAEFLRTALAKETAGFKISGAEKIVIACSGGADSVCALLLTWAAFPREREKMLVAHLNHETRGSESDGDEAFAGTVAAALGLKFVSAKLSAFVPAGMHTEAHFREARLNFFASLAEKNTIFVQGHQADDVVETMIMRLARGAGVDGLCAPRPFSTVVRNGKTLNFIRPLISIPKEKITASLRACGVDWREDASNRENGFFRNRVRNSVIPALKKAMPENYNLYSCFLRSRDKLQQAAEMSVATNKKNAFPRTEKTADRKPFPPVEIIPENGFSGNGVRAEWTELTPELRERILAGKEKPAEFVAVPDAGGTFVLRSRLPGDRMHPLGAPGSKKIGDLFTDRKIPREQRVNAPVLVCGNEILWCAGLPVAETAKIVSETKHCLKMSLV